MSQRGGRGGGRGGHNGGGKPAAQSNDQAAGSSSGADSTSGGGGGGGGAKRGGRGGGRGGGGGGGGGGDDARRRAEADKKRLAEEAERRAAEAERAKAEAEAKRLADIAAARAKEEAEAAARAAEEQRALFAASRTKYEEEQALWAVRLSLREANLAAAESHTPFQPSAKMDSSIKKCSGYLKKLKLLQEHSQDSLLRELSTVTLHKYVSEVVTTMLEVRLSKSADLFKALQVASVMHQRHGAEEFTTNLVVGLAKVFDGQRTTWKRAQQERQNAAAASATTQTQAEIEEEKANNTRKRQTLRFMTELFLCGLTSDMKPLLVVLADIIQSDTRNEPDKSNTVIQLLNSWLKYACEPLLGLQSRNTAASFTAAGLPAAVSHPEFLTAPQRDQVLNKLFLPYSRQVRERLLTIHTQLQKLEKRAGRIQMMRGEIPLDMQEERRGLREQLTALQAQVEVYFDLLGMPFEELPTIHDAEDEMLTLVSLESSDMSALDGGDSQLGPWDDAETKIFYESLVDLRIVVPPVLLQDGNEKEKARIRREKNAKDGAATADDEEDEPAASPAAAATAGGRKAQHDDDDSYLGNWDMTIEQLEAKVAALNQSRASKSAVATTEADWGSLYEEDADGNPIIPERFIGKEKRSHPMETLLASMSHSLNRESVDAIAEKFCYLNTRTNRARLVEAVYTLPRTRIDEIPYWCRLIATLTQHMSRDMADELIHLFTGEFYRLLRGKSQYRLESKVRNIRFLTELVKFEVAPATVIFKCWHALLTNFNTNAITLVSLILENCGRWLYRTPAHHMRAAMFLERTMQLKETKYLDKSLSLMLENAYFSVKPPPNAGAAIAPPKVRTPIHMFIRKTIFQDLRPGNTDEVLRRLRQLHWNESPTIEPELSQRVMVIKCLSNIANVAYGSIGSVAMVTSVLHKYHQIGFVVVDNVLEEIRCGLEMNRYSQNQRRLLFVTYLGKLFLFKLCDAQVIFDTLYLIITLGHEVDEQGKMTSRIDPPSDTFRIRLVVTLLEVVGPCFDHGLSRKRLDRFLLYFQRYMMLKEIVPIDLEFAVADLFEKIRPNLVRAASLEAVTRDLLHLESSDPSAPDRLLSLTAQTDDLSPNLSENEAEEDDKEDDDAEERDEEDEKDGVETNEAEKARDAAPNALLEAAMAALEEEDDADDADDDDDDEDDAFDRHGGGGRGSRRAREEDEFQAEYDRMLSDALESAKFQPRTNSMLTVQAVSSAAGLPETRTPLSAASTTIDGEEHAVYHFLSRNPKKQTTQSRALFVPAESDMVSSAVANQAQQAREKEEQKRLVLKGLQRTEREQAEEERLAREERMRAERFATLAPDSATHRPSSSASSTGPVVSSSLARVGANYGSKQRKEKDDLTLKVSDFAFASEETLTQSRVTLQGGRPQYQGKK